MGCALQTRAKLLFCGTVFGILISFAAGLVENQPEATVIGFRHYGYPLVWRVTKTVQPTEFLLTSLMIDVAFWIVVSIFGLIFLKSMIFPKLVAGMKYETLILTLVLLIPLGLFMDVIHEFGHAIWGTAVGGTLAYMKIAYLEIFPRLAITPQFILGYVEVHGLSTDSQYGLFLLGGSLTTNIVSWAVALSQLKLNLGQKTKVTLKTLGLFGLLDLPLYVFLPQIGLQHWLFLGGNTPEPLIGARKIGIPDIIFYVIVVLATLDLVFLYFKPVRQKIREKIQSLRATS